MNTPSSPAFAAFIGLDWANKKHDVCLRVAGQEKVQHKVITHTPEALDAWAITLRERFNGQPIDICLELSRGPIVAALQKHDFFVIFPINPATLAGTVGPSSSAAPRMTPLTPSSPSTFSAATASTSSP